MKLIYTAAEFNSIRQLANGNAKMESLVKQPGAIIHEDGSVEFTINEGFMLGGMKIATKHRNKIIMVAEMFKMAMELCKSLIDDIKKEAANLPSPF